jgi:tRNA-specific 2-thiouridylase
MQAADTVVVALSGGVDSAVACGLAVEAGLRVVGISMRLYDASGTSASIGGRCCGPRDLEDARRVCAHLGVPFYVANHADEFEHGVVDDFVAEYAAGRTPNPCVRCNERIKFLPLARRARALGAESLWTGHYARIEERGGRRRLLRALDSAKDQSYFLFGMGQAALSFVHFPLGNLDKSTVRTHARRLGLPNWDKPDSQEICFVPDGDHAAFVARRLEHGGFAGDIVDDAGRVLGRHPGVHHYTIGQRRGLGLGAGEPLYVVRLDAARRQVVVGAACLLERRELEVADVRWLGGEAPAGPLEASVQIRYRHAPRPARISPSGTAGARVLFEAPERAIAPGQAAVFYRGDEVLGGGWIQ